MKTIHNAAQEDLYHSTVGQDQPVQADGRIMGTMLELRDFSLNAIYPRIAPGVSTKTTKSIFAGYPLAGDLANVERPGSIPEG
jgi:hypothetical protein